MIKGRALDHIGIACTDVEKDAAWYMDTLGFTLKGRFRSAGRKYYTYFVENPFGTVYEIFQRDDLDEKVQGKIDHIAYVSNDIEADYKFCVDAGYEICTNGIEDIPDRWEKGCRYFKIVSPTGEQIEFSQVL